jgi:hypothetical protein
MKSTTNYNRPFIYMTLLLTAAFALRLWGIWFGLPFSYHPDEYHEVFRALELGSGGFNLDRTGKGGYFYVLFVEYGFLFVALKIAGIVDSAQDFARYYFRDPSSFYLIGRATTALIGTLNVYLVYRLGSRAYSVGAGLLAAVFLAFDFLNTEHSHFVTVDVPMTCLATGALLFAVRMVTGGGPRDYKVAALFAALATTTKLPAILLLIPLVIAHYYYVKQQDGAARNFFLGRDLWWAAGIFVGVLAITNPGLFLRVPFGMMFSGAEGMDPEVIEGEFVDTMLAVGPNLFAYYWDAFVNSMGWPLLIVSLAGSVYALWKRTPTDVMLVAFAAVWYVVFCATDSALYYPRYMLPVIVVLTVFAGRALYDGWIRTGQLIAPRRFVVPRQIVAFTVIVVAVISPVYATITNNILLTQEDTRTLAKEWFENNVPGGSKVLIEGLTIEPTGHTVPLHDSAENLREILEYYKGIGDRGKVTYLQFKLQVIPKRTYDLELMQHAELKSLEDYKAAGVQYLVIRPESLENSRKSGAAALAFFEALRTDPDVSLIKSFRLDPQSRTGPAIDVYRIDSNAIRSSKSLEGAFRVPSSW